jgi:serine/threonine protein kinase/tetratricopeptide (TPR) repeat protein
MKTATTVCGRCGAKISSNATREVCPACLLETGLGLLADRKKTTRPARHGESVLWRTTILGDFGDYELLEEIGRGGQGVVFRARQKSLNRTVALKVIGLGYWATRAHLKRFRREAEAAASLDHSGIVPIYEVGEHEGSCYFSMKFVEGGQLDEVIKREPMSIRQAAELIAKVARTVHYAHEHGILHRDIKPGNILLDAKGEPLLTDFGLARLVEAESTVTRTLEVMGTPSYMAPEQAAGEHTKLSEATDVYGLGAVLYQLLTGHPPFAGGTTFETVRLVLDTEPRQPRLWNPKIDRELSTICLKCLGKDPKHRYSSALALTEDLEHWLRHEPIQARHTGMFARGKKWVRRNPTSTLLAASLVALAAAAGWIVWKSEFVPLPSTTAPEKSIAVLPFENLSEEKQNAYFTDGVQDEILTDLARIADLKVVSRGSVMQYKSGVARNLRKIGQQLGVAHVVEGSVQRTGNSVRVNAQLLDARTDRHLWAQTYDRDLADVFAIQSEIAQKIADQLQAKLSPREKSAMNGRPTSDMVAYDLYVRAKQLIADSDANPDPSREDLFKAVQLLEQAVARDPSFLFAHCELSYAHDELYWFSLDHSETRLASAETNVRAAVRLQPDLGETHLAQAIHFYWGYRNYDRAREELAQAQRTLPNNPEIFHFLGAIDRRQGRWDEAIRDLERVVDLDPRNAESIFNLGDTYSDLHKYGESIEMYNRALALQPHSIDLRTFPARVKVDAQAETAPLRAVVNTIEAEGPSSAVEVANISFQLALRERDPAAAARALAKIPSDGYTEPHLPAFHFPRAWCEALLAKMRRDANGAYSAFTAARAEAEKIVRAQPGYETPLSVLALIDAELGEKEKATQEGRAACDLVPVAKDAPRGVQLIINLARIYALTDEKDLALERLEILSKLPSGPSYGQLRLDPEWDSLRGDPRFEKLVEKSKKPVALK